MLDAELPNALWARGCFVPLLSILDFTFSIFEWWKSPHTHKYKETGRALWWRSKKSTTIFGGGTYPFNPASIMLATACIITLPSPLFPSLVLPLVQSSCIVRVAGFDESALQLTRRSSLFKISLWNLKSETVTRNWGFLVVGTAAEQ